MASELYEFERGGNQYEVMVAWGGFVKKPQVR